MPRFLDRLSDEDRALICDMMIRRTYRRGELIISHQDTSSDVYFVLEGTAQVTIYSEGGKEVAFRRLHQGDMMGELAAIDSSPRSATVGAVNEVVAGNLSQAQFRTLVETMPSFTWALLAHMSAQSRNMTGRIFEFSTMLVRDRLILELVRLGREVGSGTRDIEVTPAPTREALACKISTHREQVSREISQLKGSGLLSIRRHKMVLHDLDALAALAAQPGLEPTT